MNIIRLYRVKHFNQRIALFFFFFSFFRDASKIKSNVCDTTAVFQQVRKSKLKTFISRLSRAEIPRQRCYLIKACTGASTIYAYERRASTKYSPHPRLTVKHHLREKINTEENNVRKYDVPLYVNTISLFVSRGSSKS